MARRNNPRRMALNLENLEARGLTTSLVGAGWDHMPTDQRPAEYPTDQRPAEFPTDQKVGNLNAGGESGLIGLLVPAVQKVR